MNKSQIINILTLTKAFLDEVSKMPIAYKSEATFTTAQGGIQGSLHEISCVISELVNDVKDELANGIEQDGWVNIKERLPKSYTNVLLYMIVPINDVPTQLIGIGYIDDENYWRYADHFGGFSYSVDNFDDKWANDFHSKWITHWQPLPNPPKQKKTKKGISASSFG